MLAVRDRVADLEAVDADNGADVTALHAVHIGLSQPVKHHELLDLVLLYHVVPLAEADLLTGPELTTGKFADGDTSDVRRILKGGHLKLRRTLNHLRGRDFRKNGIQERGDVRSRFPPVFRHPALLGAAEDSLEVKLIVGGVQGTHQVEHLFLNLVRTAVRLVHLVHDHDRLLA